MLEKREQNWMNLWRRYRNETEEMIRSLTTMGCDIGVTKYLTLLTLYDVGILISMIWC